MNFFFKFLVSVTYGHCYYSPRAPGNPATSKDLPKYLITIKKPGVKKFVTLYTAQHASV
jgi:hypothetical protein